MQSLPDTAPLADHAPIARDRFAVTASDAVSHTALEFASATLAATTPGFVLLPALGVDGAYYEPFAVELARRREATVVLTDLRGQGSSTAQARRGHDFGYREILELDFPALASALERRHPSRRWVVVGHSLGGQLATIYASHWPATIQGLALVASGTAHTAAWRGFDRAMATAYTGLIRATSAVLPWYPGQLLGFGSDHPKRLMRDWGRVVATGRYEPEGSTIDYETACRRATLPVLSGGRANDPIAPAGARQALLDRLPLAAKRAVEVPRPEGSRRWRAHFAWARKPHAVVGAIDDWMNPSP